LLTSIISLLTFFGIAEIVVQQRPLLQVDRIVAEYLLQIKTPLGLRVMTFFSQLADPGVLLFGAAGALLLAYRRRWADLALWAIALCGVSRSTGGSSRSTTWCARQSPTRCGWASIGSFRVAMRWRR
jgi:hypothetical protein